MLLEVLFGIVWIMYVGFVELCGEYLYLSLKMIKRNFMNIEVWELSSKEKIKSF